MPDPQILSIALVVLDEEGNIVQKAPLTARWKPADLDDAKDLHCASFEQEAKALLKQGILENIEPAVDRLISELPLG